MTACLTFASCDLSIGSLCKLGPISIFYFALGAFIVSTVYWLTTFVFAPEKRYLKKDGTRRILVHDENGKFDWKLVACFIGGGLITGLRYLAVCITFMVSLKANLNIGIATSIWAVSPFFSAMIDFLLFKKSLLTSHLIGIFFMLSCALMSAFSEFAKPVS